jgi:23S rRNA (cytosine1962-C5)-methyltransferase
VAGGQDGVRLIHGESDGLPGVIADRFGAVVVVQLTSAGADKWRDAIVAGLVQATGCSAVYERSDSDVRRSKASAR